MQNLLPLCVQFYLELAILYVYQKDDLKKENDEMMMDFVSWPQVVSDAPRELS